MTLANDNDSKNAQNDLSPDYSKPITCSSNSQGGISVYEIDILSYGKPEYENEQLSYKNEKPWHDNPLLEALTVDPDLKSASFELKLESKPKANETHRKFVLKEKVNERKSLPSNKSKEKFKSQLKKLIIETFIEENDSNLNNLIKNLKKLENESVHLHCHEHHHHHHHHHYYVSSSKARNIKNLLRKLRSTDSKKTTNETEEKKPQENENGNKFSVDMPSTATYICSQQPTLTSPKIDFFNLENSNNIPPEQKNSKNVLPIPSSTDSFLEKNSHLVTTHTFSDGEFSKDKTDDTEIISEIEKKTSIEIKMKNLPRLLPKKLAKPECNELLESLKVLQKYLEPKVITEANTRISFIKCECPLEKEEEDEEEESENQSSDAEQETTTVLKETVDESSNQNTVKTADSDKNHYALRSSPKKSTESMKLKAYHHRVWAQQLKEELKDIKTRLRDLEKLYSRKKTKCLVINLKNDDSDINLTSNREISVFSTKTYIVKADDKFSRRSTTC